CTSWKTSSETAPHNPNAKYSKRSAARSVGSQGTGTTAPSSKPSMPPCALGWGATCASASAGWTSSADPVAGRVSAPSPASDQRVIPQQIAVAAPLADADEHVLGQPVVLADRAFEGRIAAQVVLLVRHGLAIVEGPVA